MKHYWKGLVVVFFMLCLTVPIYHGIKVMADGTVTLTDTYLDKAMYSPGSTARIYVDLKNDATSAWSGTVYFEITHLENVVDTETISATVPASSESTVYLDWSLPTNDFTGYMVKAYTTPTVYATTAIDCSSEPEYRRYGYVGSYEADQIDSAGDIIDELTQKYHINMFQLYDWMYRHEDLLAETNGTVDASWQDLFNRTIVYDTITDYVDRIQDKNALAMAYVMSYAAREGYSAGGINPSWGIFSDLNHSSQLNVDFGNNSTYLWLFDPSNKDWQDYMIDEYKQAINIVGFDGLQIDQMGQRNNVYNYEGRPLDLKTTFSSYVNSVKEALNLNNTNKSTVTFNIVDGWANYDVVNNAKTDFSFSEIWWLSNNYNDLKSYIEQVRGDSNGKQLVLAAYMNYNDNNGDCYEAESAVLTNVSTNTDHSGYSGTGFVDGFATQGDAVTFTISAVEDGDYSLVFTYANSIGWAATRNIYIDNVKVQTVSFANQSNWDTWAYDSYLCAYLTQGTHTVKVSYDADNTGAINLDCLTLGTFDSNSILLTDAMMAACGASHIELGVGNNQIAMLAHEYYPMQSKAVRSSLSTQLTEYYDFMTAYENLLYDADINYSDNGTQFVSIANEQVSGSGEAGKLWTIQRSTQDYQILHLINLTGEDNTLWRDTTGSPVSKSNLNVKYYIGPDAAVSGVYLASPDLGDGISSSLSYSTGSDSTGTYISFTVPSLEYWDMIYIDRTVINSAQKYEAESAVKVSVSTNTNHTGYSGTGFVDSFAEVGDSVSFSITIPEDGSYTLKLRYANATGSEAARDIYIDGSFVNRTYCKSLSNWDTWGDAEVGAQLGAGIHEVVVYYGSDEYTAINLDYLAVEEKVESARSLYMNNWNNMVAIWEDTVLNQNSAENSSGPGIYELRYYTDDYSYTTDNIVNYSSFIYDNTTNTAYTTGADFDSVGYFNDAGILVNEYIRYQDGSMPFGFKKEYAMIPEENFMIVKYTITNTSASTKSYSVMDMLHAANSGSNALSASYNTSTQSTVIDMSNADQPYLIHGALGSVTSYQVADDTVSSTGTAACSPWYSFDEDGTLNNNSSVNCADISTAYMNTVSLDCGYSASFYYYIGLASTSSQAASLISEVNSYSGSAWMDEMSTEYQAWLNEGITTDFDDEELNTAYDRTLILMKQATVPGTTQVNGETVISFAACPATTNPSSYSYKVWARDSAVTAMSLDASGHLTEAGNYWRWLADRQISTDQGGWKQPGTFWTCYWIWDNSPVSFVEPEYDSIGMFLIGAYRHYERLSGTEKTDFLEDIWPAYRRSADFVLNNITSAGFGVADCSIWEETSEYNAFTQALYIAGLDAAQYMASAMGLQTVADMYCGGASTMRTAVQRDDSSYPAGLWNLDEGYYNRAVSTSGGLNTLHDSSSDVLIAYGVIDAMSSRASSHISEIIGELGHDEYGVARYSDDGFYHRMTWDPGGNEALEDEPSWPQMAMWIAMYEIQTQTEANLQNAYRRLQWYVSRCAEGYMPMGESISNITKKPCISTTCEPITGASYLMAALAYLDEFNMRVYSMQANAGAYSSVSVSDGCTGDWSEYQYIPYYNDKLNDTSISDDNYDMDRLYLSNDDSNIYIRIDTKGCNLPGYNAAETFAVQVYTEDYADASEELGTDVNGASLSRNMSYLFSRFSDSDSYGKYAVSNGQWSYSSSISSVIAPQWECESGRIELVIPISELSSGTGMSSNSWINMDIELLKESGTSFVTADTISIHYRVTASGTEWLKGNFN